MGAKRFGIMILSVFIFVRPSSGLTWALDPTRDYPLSPAPSPRS